MYHSIRMPQAYPHCRIYRQHTSSAITIMSAVKINNIRERRNAKGIEPPLVASDLSHTNKNFTLIHKDLLTRFTP